MLLYRCHVGVSTGRSSSHVPLPATAFSPARALTGRCAGGKPATRNLHRRSELNPIKLLSFGQGRGDLSVVRSAPRVKDYAARAGDEAKQEVNEPTERAKFVAEFSATALFNFLTCTAFGAATQAAGGNSVRALAYTMGAYGLIFPLIISIFAPISKAHFNPMVTFSMVASGQQSLKSGIAYIIAQVLGGILGAAIAFWTMPGSQQNATYLGAAAVPASRSVAQAFLGEAVAAAVFIYVLFATIVDPRGWGKLGPLSLGLTVPLLMWTTGPVSSLCINPARALGPAVVAGVWTHHWVWWTAPLLGGAVAAKIYTTFFLPTASA